MSKFIKRSLEKAKKLVKGAPFQDTEFAKKHPALTDFISCTQLDGEPRKTATLSIFFDLGQLKCFLNDRHEGQSLCVVADTFTGLWEALEATITSDDPGWRLLTPQGAQRKPKRS